MGRENFNLRQAAEHVHLEANELRHFAQRGEVPAVERGGDWYFDHRDLDEWAQRNFLAATPREQLRQHRVIAEEDRRAHREDWRVWRMLRPEGGIALDFPARTKAGVLRDMSDLAARTGLVYDVEGLFGELKAREEAASTAVGEGAAFLHARFHDPYFFEETFIAYGRSAQPIYFGAPDDEPTRHFFLICSTDHELHLHILARLAVLAHATEFLKLLDEAEDAAQVVEIVRAAEEGMVTER